MRRNTPENEKVEQEIDHILGFNLPCYQYGNIVRRQVILDLTAPGGMGGKGVIKKLLEINPNVKAVVSSSYSTDPILSDFKKHGSVE